jgi:hypothetical protein
MDEPQGTNSKRKQLVKLTYTHEAMIDLILQDPTVTQSELAAVFNLTPGWIQVVLNSDSFQARLAQRKAALVDPQITRTLNERLKTVAIQSMDIISEKLADERSAAYAIDALGLASSALTLHNKQKR